MRALLERKLSAKLGGAAIAPLAILFALNALDELDRGAFGALAPEIRNAFHLNNEQFGALIALALPATLLGSLPLGALADRFRRTHISGVVAVVWIGFALLTAMAPVVWVLALARAGAGLAQAASGPVHRSLLADAYTVEVRAKVYGWHQVATPVGLAIGPLIGAVLVAPVFGWRAAFVVLAIPMAFAAWAVLKLREPERGASEAAVPVRPAPRTREAFNVLRRMPTMRRLWAAYAFVGAGALALAPLLALFYEEVFAVGLTGRGILAAVYGVGNAIGMVAGGPMGDRAFARGPQYLLRAAAAALAACTLAVALFALAPWVWLAGVISFTVGVTAGACLPPLLASVALISPADMRGKAFGLLNIFAVAGVLFVPIAGGIADSSGFRLAIMSTVPFLGLSAVMCEAASRSMAGDLRRLANLAGEQSRAGAGFGGLQCVAVEAGYTLAPVLQGVDVHVDPGEFVALVGLNGSGKSTLFKAIFGQLPLRGGSVYWKGERIDHLPTWDRVPLGIVHVPQGRHLFDDFTVAQNLELGAEPIRHDPERVRRQREFVLDIFPRLRERQDQRVGSMSGGEQQMVAIGRGLMADPELMLLDEVSLGLSPVMAQEVAAALGQINARGIAVLIIEHRPWLLEGNATRVYFLDRGEVAWQGSMDEALALGKVQDFYLSGSVADPVEERPTVEQILAGIRGLGPRRMAALQSHFGDLERLREDGAELETVPGLPGTLVRAIRERLGE